MESVVANLARARRETLHGRDYLVAPVTLLVSGVLRGSAGALYYPPELVAGDVSGWNGMPITKGHPVRNGRHVTARDPVILAEQGLGSVYRVSNPESRWDGEAWFDEGQTRKLTPEVLADLLAGRPVEVSTGLFTVREPAPAGATHNGRPYAEVVTSYTPDHLAVLVGERGACSVDDGCGVGVTANADYLLLSRLHNLLAASGPVVVEDARGGWVVYRSGDRTLKRQYATAEDGSVTLNDGEPVEVKRVGHYYRTPPAKGDTPMGNKAETVAWLVSNCDCWKGNRADLEKLSDATLDRLRKKAEADKADPKAVLNSVRLALVTNADGTSSIDWGKLAALLGVEVDLKGDPVGAIAALKEKLQGVLATLDGKPAKEEEPAPEAAPVTMAANRTAPVAPLAKPLTLKEMLANATPQERAVWDNAVAIEQRERQALVERLTANVADPARRASLARTLSAKPLAELADMLALLPPPAEHTPEPAYHPSYFGAAGGPVGNAAKDDSDNVLPMPTVNFDEMASPRLRGKTA